MTTALLLMGCAALLAPCYLRLGLLHPMTITIILWSLIALLLVIRPFNFVAPDMRVTVAILAGLASLCAAPVLLARVRPQLPPDEGEPTVSLSIRVWALVVATVLLLLVVAYGVYAFRNGISAALGGKPFSQLDPKLVRYAELYGNVHISPLATLAFSLAPLLGLVAVIGALCHRWWWLLLLPATLAVTMQSPSRTTTISVAASAIFFYVLLSQTSGRRLAIRGPRLTTGRALALLGTVGALGLLYFGWVGNALDKSTLEPGLVASAWVPASLAQPLVYQMGGVSAFTVALQHPVGTAGPYGHFGRSIYAFTKIAGLLGIQLPRPQPFADYVNIPTPFNTYTAFGDVYFDLGLAGLIGLFLLTGLLVHVLSRWPWQGHPGAMWALSTMAIVFTSTPLHMRLLDGDVLNQAIGGWILLACVLKPSRTRRSPADRDVDPTKREGLPVAAEGVPT